MNIKRRNVSEELREGSADFVSDPDNPHFAPTQEDVKAAKILFKLASKNDKGTLTEEEAQSICDALESTGPIIVTTNTERWVETTR